MSEETLPQTNPAAPGHTTSEFKLAAAVAVFAGLVGGIESAVMLAKDAFPTAWWLPLVAGLVTMLSAAVAYLRNRYLVKSALIVSGTQVVVAQEASKPNP